MNYNSIQYESSYGTMEQLPPVTLPEIAFSGRSNVGKSSLINKLFNRKSLARVSSVPGKTTTVNFFKCENIRFVDLPGYGFAKRSDSEKIRWANLMEGYFNSNRDIKLVFQLIDVRHTPSQEDYDMLNFLTATGYEYAIILTKCDKLKKSEMQKRREELKEELKGNTAIKIIEFSAINGMGIDEIKQIISL